MEKLSIFRKELDEIDEQLMDALARRFAICREVARYKAEMNIPMMQPGRVAEVKRRAGERALSAGLNEQFGLELYDLIISQACGLENEIIDRAKRA
ncbi:MAG TPA: chorismate mutase [Bryobacteraceae bacterium]|nr:chorismate mutase [Bryobacteraceae bacterium]